MTITIPKEKTSSSNNNNVELEYIEDQQQEGVAVVKPSTTSNRTIAVNDEIRRREAADASRESCCTQKCCHYCLAIWCCLILINSLIGFVIRMGALSNTYSAPKYDYTPQPSMPSAAPTGRPSPSPTIGFSNLPTSSSMPTLENGFRSIANEPGVIQLHRDSDNLNLLSPDVKFPSPMKWSDEHEPITSLSAYVGGSIRLGCGGEDSYGGGFCPSITSIVRTQQYLSDSLLVPSYRMNVYVLFASEADTTSDGDPFVTISWESNVAYTSDQERN